LSELEQLKAMLTRAGIEYTIETQDNDVQLHVENGATPPFMEKGYMCFFSEWTFRDGVLCTVAHWE
jgi:hypothetical protein